MILIAATAAVALMRLRHDLPLNPAAVRDAVRAWGPLAPVIFAGAFVLRPFIFFPSTLLFLAGGLAFGVGWGTVYAAVGGTLGAVVGFGVARGLGHEFVRARLGSHWADLQRNMWSAGAVFILNLIPVMPLTAINYCAGLSEMEMVPFTLAVAAGLTPRAFVYSFCGQALLNIGSRQLAVALALLGATLVVSLLLGRQLRRRSTASRAAATAAPHML